MDAYYYIYIFDYISGSLYEIAVSKDNAAAYTHEEIIINNGFKLDDINYMCSDEKLNICKITY